MPCADGGAGLRGRPAQDEAEGGVCGEDRSVRRTTFGGCVAAGQRRERVHSDAGDSRVAGTLSGPAPGGAAAARVSQMIRALLLRNGAADLPVRRVFSARGPRGCRGGLAARGGARCSASAHVLAAIQAEALPRRPWSSARAAGRSDCGRARPLVGMGPVLALTLRAEIGTARAFARGPNWPATRAWCHGSSQRGSVPRAGRITKEGSPWLRWALVEAAMHAIRRARRHRPLGPPAGREERRRDSASGPRPSPV